MDRSFAHPALQWLRSATFAALALGGVSSLHAQLPVAELKTISPPGGKQGATIDAQIAGTDLDGPTTLLFSHPGITAAPKMEEPGPLVKTPHPIDNQFSITIAADTPPGIYEVRAVGRFGASNPRAFMVGTLEEARDNGNNHTPATAQEIPVGTAVSGATDADNIDLYKLNLKQGQRLLIDCWGRRIDSRIDSTLVLYDDKGRELRRERDTATQDALLDFTAPADGAFVVAVQDFLYRGGPEFFYRLRAHSGPHVDSVFPPVVQPGQAAKVTILGRNLPGGQPADELRLEGRPLEKLEVDITAPADEAARQQLAVPAYVAPSMGSLDTFAWQFTSPQGAADPVSIAFAADPVAVEQEPNDQASQVNKVTAPCEYVGRFYPGEDRDWVQFDAKKGDVFSIEVVAQRIGMESDPFLLIQKVTKNDKGEEQVSDVTQVDDPGDRNNRIGTDLDTSTDDPAFRLQVGEDASFRVLVRDQFGSGRIDPRCVYRLIIRRERPDFRLLVTPQSSPAQNDQQIPQYASVLRRGGTAFVQVRLERLDGFDGEVELAAEGLPQGVACAGAVLSGQNKDAALIFTADENAPTWSGRVTITGKAKIAGQDVVRQGRAATRVWGTANRQQDPPSSRMARDLVLSVIEKETDAALVKIGDGSVIESSKGAKVEIPVTFAWRREIKGELQLAQVGAPNEFQVKNFNVKHGQGDAKVEFVLTNNNVQPGAYTFYLRGQSKLDYERNPDLIKDYEDRQKEIDQTVAEMTEKAKQAVEAKTKATQAAAEAANVVKQKEQAAAAAKPEEAEKAKQELTAAQEAAKAADAAKAQTEEEDRKSQELVKQAGERKKQVDNQLNEVKKNNAKKEVNYFAISTPVKLRVAPDPIQATVQPPAAVKQGAKVELPVTVSRLYGFEDDVEVTFEPPSGVAGLSAPKITIAKSATEGKLEISAAGNATVGDHTVNLRFRVKFNNLQLDDVVPLPVKVEAAQ